jgi:transposase
MANRITVEIDGRNCIGLDVGDRWSFFHIEDALGKEVETGKVKTTPQAVHDAIGTMEPARVALEVGTHSPWLSELLTKMGHEVTVANAYRVSLVSRNHRKEDRVDAKFLCWLLRANPALLFPIRHRGPQARADLALIRSRDEVVRTRTSHINHVRGAVKPFGVRIPSMSPCAFARRARGYIPRALAKALDSVLKLIALENAQIKELDRQIRCLCTERYPETERLMQVTGVGPITALTFVLTIEDPCRFERTREIGPYLGLVPRLRSSGKVNPELSITKAGDERLRRLLTQCAHHILGRHGPETDLRRFGEALQARGKKNAKKKAVTAVARKLAVLLLALWKSGEDYVPLRKEKEAA